MPETRHELHPETLRLLDRMLGPPPSHDRFAGPPIRWDQLDALALGDLWTTARKVSRAEGHFTSPGIAAGTARAILDRGKEMEPVFRGAACRDYLDLLALELENTADKNVYGFAGSECEAARFALSRCIELTFDDIGRAAGRFLTLLEPKDRPHLALALARLAGCEARILDQLSADLADSPLFVDELRAVAAFGIATNLASDHVRYPSLDASAPSDEFQRLSEDADYAVLTEATLRHAAERIRLIHDRTSPYAADKAFTVQESGVIARLARIALKRDESWLPPVLDALFRKVSLAPTAAKSLPSQSVAVALGHAVEAFPTPEAVATLRAVLHDIRHAGVKKKLQRNLGGAERGLADRPEVALRLPADQPVSKQQLTTLARCLEASLATGMVLGYADWRSRLAEHPQAKMLAGALVWRMGDGVSVMPSIEHGHLVLRDAAGATVTPSDDCRVTLWHPCEATGTEREAWRDRLASLRIKQPFKQVFREHYAVPAEELDRAETAMFDGHSVSIRPFLGVARRERWKDGYMDLTRRFDRWTATLDLADNIYPGAAGGTTVGKLSLSASGGQKASPVRLGDLPTAALSEILRSVDLLVSVGGFAVSEEPHEPERRLRIWQLAETPLGAMAEMRRRALQYALRGLAETADLQFDARHLRLGRYTVHLATGRVTRDGDPVEIDLPKRTKLAAVPWLPYDEKLLETICYTAIEIAARAATGH
jgi:hypothetical protein